MAGPLKFENVYGEVPTHKIHKNSLEFLRIRWNKFADAVSFK